MVLLSVNFFVFHFFSVANFDNKEITPRTYVIAENVGHYLNYEAERGIFVRPHPFARNEMKFKKKNNCKFGINFKGCREGREGNRKLTFIFVAARGAVGVTDGSSVGG